MSKAVEVALWVLFAIIAIIAAAMVPESKIGTEGVFGLSVRDGLLSMSMLMAACAAAMHALRDGLSGKDETASLALPMACAALVFAIATAGLFAQHSMESLESSSEPISVTATYVGVEDAVGGPFMQVLPASPKAVFEQDDAEKFPLRMSPKDVSEGGALDSMGLETGKLYLVKYYPGSLCLHSVTGPIDNA